MRLIWSYFLLGTAASVLATPAVAQKPSPAGQTINLICTGQGQKHEDNFVDTLEWDKYDHRYKTRTGVQETTRTFESVVTVQIQGNDGRIRLASTMIPLIHSGGDRQNWWQLKKIKINNDEIRASYDLNAANEADVVIDRTTGTITIKSLAPDYTGMCSKIDPGQRRF